MKKLTKNVIVGLCLLGVSLSCSKSADPAPTVGCNVTFKGIKVTLLDLICGTSLGNPSVNATNLPQEQELGLINSDALKSISFVTSGDPDSYYSSTFVGTAPTITVSGMTWTFSGTLANSTGDTGAITGTCTCAN